MLENSQAAQTDTRSGSHSGAATSSRSGTWVASGSCSRRPGKTIPNSTSE